MKIDFPPASLAEGRSALAKLVTEIDKLNVQLDDPGRRARDDFPKWAGLAHAALRHMLRERTQLEVWIEMQEAQAFWEEEDHA